MRVDTIVNCLLLLLPASVTNARRTGKVRRRGKKADAFEQKRARRKKFLRSNFRHLKGANSALLSTPTSFSSICGCAGCTPDVWNAMADGFSCGERILFVSEQPGKTLSDACSLVAGSEFPEICAACDPANCSGGEIAVMPQSREAVAASPPSEGARCGCAACDEAVWNTLVEGYSCGARIEWLQQESFKSEAEACEAVATEYPTVCGPKCSPSQCGDGSVRTNEQPEIENSLLSATNVIIFDPSTHDTVEIQSTFDRIFRQQVNAEMGTDRYSLYFKPGVYGSPEQPLMLQMGYYTEVAGLGKTPQDVRIYGKIEVHNRCFEPEPYKAGKFIPMTGGSGAVCFALNTFWRSLSNVAITVVTPAYQDACRSTAMFWAISQASSMRRVDITGGDISLMDYCTNPAFASGGFMADSRVSGGKIISGSQQQFFSRNMDIDRWEGAVWNQVFMGVVGAPDDSQYPEVPYTTFARSPIRRERPFLFVEPATGDYFVHVPKAVQGTRGISWKGGQVAPGITLPLSSFFVVRPGRFSVAEINQKLRAGRHLLFTPGVYDINASIDVVNADTVVLGMGHATLTAVDGAIPLRLSDRPGIVVASITIDAGLINSPVLLQVGPPGSNEATDTQSPQNPITLSDVYFRLGGPHIGKADVSLEINSNHVLIDHTWVWRADHGKEGFDPRAGFDGDDERWTINTGRNGVVVNGHDVVATGLFVEHYQEYNLLWKGERGRVFFFQNELPYDPPTQADWMAKDGTTGWAAYKVDDSVKSHELWAGGAYAYNRNNPDIITHSGFQVPSRSAGGDSGAGGVQVHRVYTRNLSGPGTIRHVINDSGPQVDGEDRGPYYQLSYP